MGGNDYENAPSTLIGKLRDALQTYATQPSNLTSAQAAVAAANDVANGLNSASAATQKVRSDADAQIAADVADLNDLLSQFQTVNAAIVKGTQAGTDISDELDQRDKLLKSISNHVGIDTVQRANNDTVIYTTDGTTLFETVPRTVSFTPTLNYADGVAGNSVMIDGVPLKPGTGADSTAKGSLQALLQLRDDIAPQYQDQLDEIARGLVQTFRETDQSGSSLPDMPGLFTWSGGTVPASTSDPDRHCRDDQGQCRRRPEPGRKPDAAQGRRHQCRRAGRAGLCVEHLRRGRLFHPARQLRHRRSTRR